MDTAQTIQNLFNETRFPGRRVPLMIEHKPTPKARRMYSYADCYPDFMPGSANSCVVRAAIVATGESPTEVARIINPLREKTRRGMGGAYHSKYAPVLVKQFGFTEPIYWYQHENPFGRMTKPTIAQWLKRHQKGRWFLVVDGHALAVIDGVVHDWPLLAPKMRRRVLAWHKLEEA